jgi:shikimate kinase
MNIAFIGYRASGKTTISEKLTRIIGWKKIELDREIEKTFGMKIPQIINKFGWQDFRSCESILIGKFSKHDNLILDLGGGAILNEQNMMNIKKNSIVIYLESPPDVLIKRLKFSSNRPVLTDLKLEDEVTTTLNTRMPLYRKYADYSVNTGYQPIQSSLFEIYDYLLKYLEPANITEYGVIYKNKYSYA